jgi:uncharacterized protein YecE (DUF72 family)
MAKWFIGCSGFHYKHWKGIFYPEKLAQTKWFDFYCEHFNTLELNVTFYRFPQLSFLQTWYNKSTPSFRFAIKAPRAITHYKKFIDTDRLMADFYNTIEEGLKEKLGTVLFQMPPRYDYTEERLERIINSLDKTFNNVLEFRHVSWWNAEVYKELSKRKISFCGMSHPLLPDDIIQNTSLLYYRMHGVPELYQSPYEIADLKKIIDEVESSGKTKRAFIYFNNDIDVSAVRNAKEMIGLINY